MREIDLMPVEQAKSGWSLLKGCLFVLTLAFMGCSALVCCFMWRIHENNQCRDNILRINYAVVWYAKEHRGWLPESLDLLSPRYLESLPRCSIFALTRYSIKLRLNSLDPRLPPSERYKVEQLVDEGQFVRASHYRIFCQGHGHPGWGVDEPGLDDEFGLGPSNDHI